MNSEYQEIDLIKLFKRILKYWWLIIFFIAVAAVSSYYVTKNYVVPLYEANATVFIGKESGNMSVSLSESFFVGSELIADYKELVKTNQVLNQVIQDLELITDTNTLRKKIEVEVVGDSRFIYISAVDKDPAMAVAIADKVSDVLKVKAESIVGAKNVYVVDYAPLPLYYFSPSTSKNVAIAGVLGMMLALAIIAVNMMMNTTFDKEEDIEHSTGLTVIGVIPKFKGELRNAK